MILDSRSSFIIFVLLIYLFSFSFGSDRSSSLLTSNFDDNRRRSNDEEESFPSEHTDDENQEEFELVVERKRQKASYQYEQALLADIYSPNRTYVAVHDDRIAPFNFSYFTFKGLGSYRLILISIQGDADLYVSTRDKHVTYENYELSSWTCGIDELVIDSMMKRPIHIGIYGYSPHRTSHYRFLIEFIEPTITHQQLDAEQQFYPSSDTNNNGEKTNKYTQQSSSKTHSNSRVTINENDQDDRQHILWNIFVWLLNFLVEVLT